MRSYTVAVKCWESYINLCCLYILQKSGKEEEEEEQVEVEEEQKPRK